MTADVDQSAGHLAGAPGKASTETSVVRSRLFVKYVALLIAVVVLALIANGAFEVWFSYQEQKAALIEVQHEQAVAAADKIEGFVTQIQSQLGWTTQLPWSDSTLEQRRFDALRLLRQVPAITELAQIDASGHEQLKVSRLAMDVIGSGADFSTKPEFTEAVAKKTYYGPVYFRRESEPYMTLALAGARRDSGVSVAQVNLKLIWDVVSKIKAGQHGHAYVVDADGRLIAHPDISLVLRNTDMSRLVQVHSARSGGTSEDVREADDVAGRRVLTAYAPVAPLGWFVFVETPIEEAYAPLYASIARTGYVLLGALALAFLAGLVLARKMVVPIQALRAGAARLGAGDLGQRISIKTGDEIEGLANQFNDMAGQLQESYADLEKKVEQRTAELSASLEQQTAISEILRVISNSPNDVRPVLSAVAEYAARICEAQIADIILVEDNVLRVGASFGQLGRPLSVEAIPLDRTTVMGRSIIDMQPVQNADQQNAGDDYALGREFALKFGHRTILAVPLLREGHALGTIVVRRTEVRPFDHADIALLTTFADQAAIAIENVRLFEQIQEKSRQLEEASRHKSQFLANMSHELRTPLNAILGYTELVLDGIYGDAPDKMRTVLERVQTNGKHLLGLINDVLDLSKIEAGQLVLTLDDFSIREMMQGVYVAVEPLANTKKLQFKLSAPADLPRARGDERRLSQVLLNLVGNAIKFTDRGEVAMSATAANGSYTVSVRDTGPGIAEADQAKIFEEFQQSDSTKTKAKGGTGLGLSIAKRIVELHGGRLWVESTPGDGATFSFTVPLQVDKQAGKA